MQIFASDKCPMMSAMFLDDKRRIKMILESAQLMSTAMHVHGIEGAPYKITHKNHPCAIWARKTKENYTWLFNHFVALCLEYKMAYKRQHKCEEYLKVFKNAYKYIPKGKLTPFPNCTPFKHITDIHHAYKVCLMHKWAKDKRKPTWKTAGKPDWYNSIYYMKSIKNEI